MVGNQLSYSFTPTLLDFEGGIGIPFRIDVLSYVGYSAYDWNPEVSI